MKTIRQTTKLTRAFNKSLYVIYLLSLTLIFIVVAETILRSKNISAWDKRDVSIEVEPGGKFFKLNPTLGYTHIPGKFEVILRSGYSFNVTHLPNTLRVTSPMNNTIEKKSKEDIWIFGCSFTHGWSLNDNETYPWLLQERFPEYNVVNFGVSGYGTIHSLIQFKEALKTKTPKVVVLAYANLHGIRNTFSRARRKNVSRWNKLGPLIQPYARLNFDGELQYYFAEIEYTEFPLMRRLALAHFIEKSYNKYEITKHNTKIVSKALIEEMADLAKHHEVKFIVANINRRPVKLKFLDNTDIAIVDVFVDGTLPENTNRPHDGHPSAIANKKYADQLEHALIAELSH